MSMFKNPVSFIENLLSLTKYPESRLENSVAAGIRVLSTRVRALSTGVGNWSEGVHIKNIF